MITVCWIYRFHKKHPTDGKSQTACENALNEIDTTNYKSLGYFLTSVDLQVTLAYANNSSRDTKL